MLDDLTKYSDNDLVSEAIYKIIPNRTSVVVTNKLEIIERCTHVAVLEEGQIVECGTF